MIDNDDELEETFRVFDYDGDGLISPIELYHGMRDLGENFKREEIE